MAAKRVVIRSNGNLNDEPSLFIFRLRRDSVQVAGRSYTHGIPRLFHQYGGKGKNTSKDSIAGEKNEYLNIIRDMGIALEADTFIDAYAGSATCTFLAMMATKENYTQPAPKRGRKPKNSNPNPISQIKKTGTPLFRHFVINEKDYPIYCLFTIAQRKKDQGSPNIDDLKAALGKTQYCKYNYDSATMVLQHYYYAEAYKKAAELGQPLNEVYNYDKYQSDTDRENALRKGSRYSDLELAVATFITHNMSRDGSQNGFNPVTNSSNNQNYKKDLKFGSLIKYQLDDVHKFLNLELMDFDGVPDYPDPKYYAAPHQYSVTIKNEDAADIIDTVVMAPKKTQKAVLFLDPPYLPSVRAVNAQNTYGSTEQSIIDHKVSIFQKLEMEDSIGWIMCGKVDTQNSAVNAAAISNLLAKTDYKMLDKPYIAREDLVGTNTAASRSKTTSKKQVELIWHNP